MVHARRTVHHFGSLETSLGISKTEVNASINRSIYSGLAIKDHKFVEDIPIATIYATLSYTDSNLSFHQSPERWSAEFQPPLPLPRW